MTSEPRTRRPPDSGAEALQHNGSSAPDPWNLSSLGAEHRPLTRHPCGRWRRGAETRRLRDRVADGGAVTAQPGERLVLTEAHWNDDPTEEHDTMNAAERRLAAGQTRAIPAVSRAALDAGHEPSVQRVGSRFKLVCTCGWSTSSSSSRKAAFQAVADHVWQAGREHLLRDEETPDTPEVGEFPQVAGGRA